MTSRNIVVIVLAVVAIIFFFQNFHFVRLDILFFSLRLPLIILLLAIFFAGALVGRMFPKK